MGLRPTRLSPTVRRRGGNRCDRATAFAVYRPVNVHIPLLAIFVGGACTSTSHEAPEPESRPEAKVQPQKRTTGGSLACVEDLDCVMCGDAPCVWVPVRRGGGGMPRDDRQLFRRSLLDDGGIVAGLGSVSCVQDPPGRARATTTVKFGSSVAAAISTPRSRRLRLPSARRPSSVRGDSARGRTRRAVIRMRNGACSTCRTSSSG